MQKKPGENIFSRSYSAWSNLIFVLTHIWQHDKALIPLMILNALLQALAPFFALFLPKAVIDAINSSTNAQAQVIGTVLLLSLGILLINVIVNFTEKHVQLRASQNRLRYSLLIEQKAMSMDYAHLENPLGQNAKQKAAMSTYSQRGGSQAYITNLSALLQHLCGLALYASVTALLSPLIALLMLALSILNYLALRWAQKYEMAQKDELAELNRKRWYVIDESSKFANAKDLRLYGMTDWFRHHLGLFFEGEFALTARSMRRYFGSDSVAGIVALIRDGIAYTYLIRLIINGSISLGDFSLFLGAIAGISGWFSQMAADLAGLSQAHTSLEHFRSFLDVPDRAKPTSAIAPPQQTPEIVFDHVYFRYPGSEQWILEDFCLTIQAGEKIALVGGNGAGKTTCIKLLCGLYHPDQGRILIDGVDLEDFRREDYFRLLSVVFQEVRTLAFDVKQNVALTFPQHIDIPKVEQSLALAGLEERIAEMPRGLDTQLTRSLDEQGIDLSGGQAQKLMLARALYKDGQIIIMDEPTAALDPIAEAEMYERYNRMIGGKTSIYISHRLASTRFCDRIAFLEKGRISELGSHDALMQLGGKYAEMFDVQSHYYRENLTKEKAEEESAHVSYQS